MPHLILEYSRNVMEPDFSGLFAECHRLLAERLPTQLKNCKSRAVRCEHYYVGDGDARHAFVHLTLEIMPGRSHDVLQAVGQGLLELLKKYFLIGAQPAHVGFSIEINEFTLPYTKG